MEPQGWQPRAPRYLLEMNVEYRQLGETEWQQGRTINVSRSGAIFHAPKPLEPRTPIEVLLHLPPGLAPQQRARILCNGVTTRALAPESPDAEPSLAVRFLDYSFLPSLPPLVM